VLTIDEGAALILTWIECILTIYAGKYFTKQPTEPAAEQLLMIENQSNEEALADESKKAAIEAEQKKGVFVQPKQIEFE
jgi:hypothetical protein